MTDRINGCTVIFDREIRIDDAEYLLNAIRMIKGVKIVQPVINNSSDHIIETKLIRELEEYLVWAAQNFAKYRNQ